jgi:hypothetical protein
MAPQFRVHTRCLWGIAVAKLATLDLLRDALTTLTPSLRAIAREAGLGYHAVRRYREGARTPARTVLRQLVHVLRNRADRLSRLADALDAAAGL